MKKKPKGKYFRLWLSNDTLAALKNVASRGPKRYAPNLTEIINQVLRGVK